jgi:ATP adenylyltransferase
LDTLWSPWRYRYVSRETRTRGCVFCDIAGNPGDDEANGVLGRGKLVFAVLNRFPYSTGHLMILPYEHLSELSQLSADCLTEMMLFAQHAEQVLREVYRPAGFNIGLNLGECAGAGIAGHLHLHVLPRWPGDANFMTTVGETRVIPEDLSDTWKKLAPRFAERCAGMV